MGVHVRSVHVHLRGKKEGEAKRRKEEKLQTNGKKDGSQGRTEVSVDELKERRKDGRKEGRKERTNE